LTPLAPLRVPGWCSAGLYPPVGADEPGDDPTWYLEAQLIDRHQVSVVLGQAPNADRGLVDLHRRMIDVEALSVVGPSVDL
jgi:hypothetical protein